MQWLYKVKNWAIETGRWEIVQHIVGNGLSYAQQNNDGLINDDFMRILDHKDHK